MTGVTVVYPALQRLPMPEAAQPPVWNHQGLNNPNSTELTIPIFLTRYGSDAAVQTAVSLGTRIVTSQEIPLFPPQILPARKNNYSKCEKNVYGLPM